LRQRFRHYKTQKNNNIKSKTKNQSDTKSKQASQTEISKKQKRCFNCESKDYLSADCPDKAKGAKCFKCGSFGHVSTKCTNTVKKKVAEDAKTIRMDAVKSNDKKTTTIFGKSATAIIDSGSDLHLIRLSLYKQLNAELEQISIPFDGVGSTNNRTLGRFKTDVIIDGLLFAFVFDVIPDDLIGHDLIIDGELSDHAEFRLKKRQMTLTRINEADGERLNDDQSENEYADANWKEVLKINVRGEERKEEVDDTLTEHVTDPEIKEKLHELVKSYQPTTSKSTGVKMCIALTDNIPVHQNPRRLSAEQKNIVNEIIDSWIKDGIVRPSTSDYASPIVLVTKKNGEPRLCVDYRMLNKKIVRDRFPLPLIEDLLDRLQSAIVFSTLDLRNGFFHVPIEEESIKYTSMYQLKRRVSNILRS